MGKKPAINQFAQGDVFFRRISSLPAGIRAAAPDKGRFVVAHSETGHHHVVDATQAVLFESGDPFVAYLQLAEDACDVNHLRGFDTHGTVSLTGGTGAVWQVARQREYTPERERSAAD